MNEQRLQQEPSMEEILASIRRIISEDEATSSKSRAPTGPTMPASTSATPGNGHAPTHRHAAETDTEAFYGTAPPRDGAAFGHAPYRPAGPDDDAAPADAYAPDGTTPDGTMPDGTTYDVYTAHDYGEESVLDLTEMVAEDGSVVTIAPIAAEMDSEAYDDTATYDDQGAYDDTLYAETGTYGSQGPYDSGYLPGQADAEGSPETETTPYGHANGHDRGVLAVDGETGREPALDRAAYAPADDAKVAYDGSGYDGGADEAAAQPVLTQGPRDDIAAVAEDDPRTVPSSSRNAKRLNNALAALAGGEDADDGAMAGAAAASNEAPATTKPARAAVPDVSVVPASAHEATREAAAEILKNPALEDMIREAMKPMLREWLDKNLSRLVEDVARQELNRMIERRGGL